MSDDEYEEIALEISDLDDETPPPPKKPRKPYTQSEKAQTQRLLNLEKAKAARAEKIRIKRELEAKAQQEDEDEYTETSEESDLEVKKNIKGAGKTKEDYPVPTTTRRGQKNKKLEEHARKLEVMIQMLAKKIKPKRRVLHKTLVVPQSAMPAPAPVAEKTNPVKEQTKKEILGLF